jgi:hypothetical protein
MPTLSTLDSKAQSAPCMLRDDTSYKTVNYGWPFPCVRVRNEESSTIQLHLLQSTIHTAGMIPQYHGVG